MMKERTVITMITFSGAEKDWELDSGTKVALLHQELGYLGNT